ncbi:Ig-like domain-containing protein, partial [Flavobacterium collinsii]
MAINIRLFKVLLILLYLIPFAGYSQVTITATATDAVCVGDGTISINVTNATGPIIYAVAKLPFDEATVIRSIDPLITHLARGDYYYGYYNGTTFVRATNPISVGGAYTTVSPTITYFAGFNYTYCGTDPDPLGTIRVGMAGVNPPYTISLFRASDNSEVQKITTAATSSYDFKNVLPGTYRVELTDNCGVKTASINTVTLAANVKFTSDNITMSSGSLEIIYNTPGDVCSGIASASYRGGFAYTQSISPALFSAVTRDSFSYKLEIQNGADWDVYDNLTYTQVIGRFSLPTDRSKWGLVRLTASYCGVSKTVTMDYGASSQGKVEALKLSSFRIADDPANTNCGTTGKVFITAYGSGGCAPYTVQVTDTATNTTQSYTSTGTNTTVDFLVDIGQTYTFKLTDRSGAEAPDYRFLNVTSNPNKPLPAVTGPNNVFIDPVYFTPAPIDQKSQIRFYRRPSGTNFGKSALAVYTPGLQGIVTVSLVNGPSPLTVTARTGHSILGENLNQGNYKIRVQDSGCFDEVFDVVLNCYFSQIEITSISSTLSATACDRYVKRVGVRVSMVGTADSFSSISDPFSRHVIYVRTVSGPVSGTGSAGSSGSLNDLLREGTYEFVYPDQTYGTYEIGLSRNLLPGGFLTTANLWEGTTTKTIEIKTNFPVFDLSQSGGIICSGNTTGDLYTKVNNVDATATYFLKKDTDTNFPATGQTDLVFRGLTAGNYVVRARTNCYDVEQPLILRVPSSLLIAGNSSYYCKGESLKLGLNPMGPIASIKWTLPDGSTLNTTELALDNLTTAQSGLYKVELNTLGGCYFTESVNITVNDPQTPTGASNQEFCTVNNATVANLSTTESNVIWYDAATAGNVISSTTALENNKIYYGSLKERNCESPTRLAVTVTLSDPKTPTGTSSQEFCKVDNKKVADLVTTESNVTWYDAATGGNVVSPTTILENNKIYYGSLKVGTCESPTRLAVTVTLSDPKTPTGTSIQEFCKVRNATVADLLTTESNVTWFDAGTGGNVISSTTALENNKVYYGSLKAGICESPTRLAVTVTLSDPKTPTTANTIQEFCKVNNSTVADLVTTESNVTWYDAATGGNVVVPTTILENNKIYYGSSKLDTCESPTRLAVTVTLRDPKTPTTNQTTQEFCKIDNKKVSDLATTESGVTWYDAATAGNVVPSTQALTDGTIYYGSLKVGTCESPTRLAVTVTLSDPKTPTTNQTTQEFCKVDNKKVSDLVTTESGVTWYDAATAGNVIASTTVLENNKIYYGSLKVGTCESPTRLAVTVTLSDPKTPTTANTTQEFCKVDNKKVSDLATTESGVTWYDAATAGNAIASTAVLENNKIYYGSLKVGTCESPTRLAVTVTLSDPKTPTTNQTTQEFCKIDNKKVSDLATTESGVTWYDAATAGNVIASTTALENNKVYYGSLKVGTCESPTRLAVTVTLSDPQTPTTANTTQEFCKVDNKKVSDLATTESGVTWYDAATAGNVVPSTAILTNGTVYYGSLKVGTCESPTRLAVTVTLSDPQTPTTNQTTQEFCKVDNKKVSDLVTTESGVTWYDAATAGNVVPSTQALTDGTIYYGSLKAGTCESPTRLAVTVTLSDPQTPTTNQTTQEFCRIDNKKVSDLATTESGVTWYDAATAGNIVPSTTTLTNGTVYYGSLKVGTCESPTRLAVTVTLSDPKTPTTNQTTQEFCKIDNKKVSDLATTESGVTWYDAATAGNIVLSTAILTNGTVYYGSLKVGTCESPTRLAVTVTLSDPQTPTTNQTTQEFCKIDNKKVSDLATTESGVTWYDAATAGNIVPSTQALTDGTVYYGSLKVGTCESPTRLAVTVTLSDPQTPTTVNTTQEFCKVDNKKVSDLATTESGVTWYDAATAGNIIASTAVLENNKIYYGSLKVGTCESPTRLAVTVTLSDPQTPTTANTTQEFCKVDNMKVSDLATTESGVTWYDAATAGTAIASTAVLENNKIYYGSLKVGTCESPTRLAVTVTLSDPQTPTTANTTQEFCKVDNKKVADLATTESGVTWYDAATAGNAIASTAVLENNKIYYGSLKVGTCESPTRLAVTVTLSDPKTPTTANTTQEFCKVDNKKVADLATTESGVTWYDAATVGNIVPSTTILTNGTVYYGSLKVGTCESPTRLAVTVTLSDPKTPTTANTTQEFCKIDNKRVADLATTESGVTWYDAVTAGNVVPSTQALIDGTIYYGSLKVGTCESPTRLAVTVTLSDPQTPTTSKTTQEFCKVDNKKVADLATTESGVTWYDAATAGTAIASTTVLENNKIYYGSLKVGTCESPTRLAVTVTLSDPQTPTTNQTTQEFCKVDNMKVSDLATTESGVTWYDAATAGNIVPSTTTLTNGTVYYGSLKVGTCESPTRLAVTVTLSDPQTPTTANTAQEFCKIDNKKVSDLATTESGVTWYDAATAGNVVPSTTTLTNGTVYYGSLKVGTCESPTRLAVTVTLSDPQTPTTANTTQEFCKIDNKKVADLATTESGVTWYDAVTAGNIVPSTTILTNGTVYYGSLKVGTCESPTRLAVTVTLSDPHTPTTANTTQEFCKIDNKKVSDLATTESGVTWYDAATAGNVIASTAVLENNKVYYGSLKVGTCESPTRLAVTVTLSDPQTPTTANTTQEFCKVDNKKVSDLATTESGVTWYDAATAGNVVPSTTTLTNGMVYYGSLKVGTCESPTRLAVTVTLSDPQTPTTANTTQEFCKVDNKKVSDLATTEPGVTWYDAVTAGNVIASTTALENNKVYYGSLKVGTCESPTRLAVTVTLSDPQTPTTNQTTQEFCKVDNKKVSDLATTESGVTWYDAATAGNVIASTTALENNKVYYGSLKVGTCESPTRLAVTVTLSDPKTPTTANTIQEFCKTDNKTAGDLITNESGVTWYDAATGGNKVDPSTLLEHNKDYYGSLKEGACESPIRLEVKVIVKSCTPEPAPNWNGNGCAFDETTYKVLSGMSNYNWFVSKEGTIVAGGQLTDDYITVLWNSVGKAIVKVDYIDVSKFDPLVSVDFPVTINSCSDIGLKKVVDNANPFIGKEVVFTITAENFGTNQAKDITISEALPSGYAYVASEASAGKYNPTSGIWTIPVLQSKESQTLKV